MEARDYLQRALAIFEMKGNVKVQKEVKAKLKLLSQSTRQTNIQMDFHEGSDYDSAGELNNAMIPKPRKKMSVKKLADTRKKTGAVKTNNFFN